MNRRNRRGRNLTDRRACVRFRADSSRNRVFTRAARRAGMLRSAKLIGPSNAARLRAALAEMSEPGARSALAAQASTSIARAWGYPNSTVSDTFCREHVALPAGEADEAETLGNAHHLFDAPTGRAPVSRCPPPDIPTCVGLPSFQGRLPLAPAKGRTIRRTQGAFRRGEKPEHATRRPDEPCDAPRTCGLTLSTRCSQPVEREPAPLLPLLPDSTLTEWRGAKARSGSAPSARRPR